MVLSLVSYLVDTGVESILMITLSVFAFTLLQ